ncbi:MULTISPECIES: hypothetical protein [Fusobacterium]|uniref:Uncharacterized protein n=2 Tax=Fusobacterium TaxID=848 RepID=A0A323TWB5_FUSNU|nr:MULTISPECIES: hypothetical protein [Fusobacterium]ALM94368.1 hypothetical protein RO02_06965 [Fusobacterium polymorphum]ALQ41690.1 hypothetical protein RN93_02460 [Fusobacterium polymorphum]MBW9311147.1 hypothetical protein [Fusobacterium nucleatum]PCR85871.1 hypothetical protein CQA79_02090 [Fusobacterium nucleatum]PZA04855.1 hypothetical protein DNF10_04465 [Fusobacterium nucleatum]
MKTVTKRENFTCIVYDEELLRKHQTILNFHLLLLIFIPLYIILFRNDEIYNYLWIIFYVLFITSYRSEPYLSKIKVILYRDKIEIKRRRKKKLYLYSEIKEIKYSKKWINREGEISFIKIMKNNGKIYEAMKGKLEKEIIEIFTIIKNNHKEWRIKNYENCDE